MMIPEWVNIKIELNDMALDSDTDGRTGDAKYARMAIDLIEELEGKLRNMHRRAQKAEGQRDRALHEVEAWQRVFGGRWSVAHHLAMSIVDSLQKVLTK